MSWQQCPSPSCETAAGDGEMVIRSKVKDLGGFQVRRVLPAPERQMIGPFIFFDHIGPAHFPPGHGVDVRPHPHIGISTVTYLFEGAIFHRDSLGSAEVIRPGAVNWMTAGRGIVHSERTPPEERATGTGLHGIQSWVALPDGNEEVEPDFQHFPADTLPELDKDGVRIRLIAGAAYGEASPVSGRRDLLYAEVTSRQGGELGLPGDCRECAVYVVEGRVDTDDNSHGAGVMIVTRPGAAIRVHADTRVMILGGDPPRRPRHIWWNLVSSSRERIEHAKADWKAGKFDPVPGDDEVMPLPDD
jgi:redox-sensitive bicupin YhaK (pirin superfamily)